MRFEATQQVGWHRECHNCLPTPSIELLAFDEAMARDLVVFHHLCGTDIDHKGLELGAHLLFFQMMEDCVCEALYLVYECEPQVLFTT